MMVFFLAGIVITCGGLCVIEGLVRIWEAMEAAKAAKVAQKRRERRERWATREC